MLTPRLKTLFCAASGDELAVSFDQRSVVTLADPDGRVRQLLEILSEGSRTPDAIASELGAPLDEVSAAIGSLDELGWLEDGAAGAYQLIDFSAACETSAESWPRDPGCDVCAIAPGGAR